MATDQEHHHDMTRTSTASDPDTATDPVCGMTVEIDEDTRSAEYDGEVFHFCSENCCRFALKYETWRFERQVLSLIARFGYLWACASRPPLRNVVNCGKQSMLFLEGAQKSNLCIVVDAGA